MVIPRDWEEGENGNYLMGRVSDELFFSDETVLEIFHNNMNILNTTELYT